MTVYLRRFGVLAAVLAVFVLASGLSLVFAMWFTANYMCAVSGNTKKVPVPAHCLFQIKRV